MEGTPLAVLEAMATGLPVVSTYHAGIPDVVAHGERGLLSAEYDIDAMADHLVQLIDHPEQAASMGQAGRAYVLACLLYTSPSPRDRTRSRMPSSA